MVVRMACHRVPLLRRRLERGYERVEVIFGLVTMKLERPRLINNIGAALIGGEEMNSYRAAPPKLRNTTKATHRRHGPPKKV
jgi:hypothetical protein